MPVDLWDNLTTPAARCSVCEKTLVEREPYFATLVDRPGIMQRRDYCLTCWKDEYRDQAFGFWQARIPAKDEKPKLLVDKDMLIQIFTRLVETEEEDNRSFTFMLMLIMMRKRLVKYVNTEHSDGKEVWVVRLTGQDHEYRLVNPNVTEEQLGQIREQLDEILAGG